MPPRASGRMLRRTISESAHFAALSPEAAVLYMMLLPHFNAHGKMPGGPGRIKDEVVPLIPYLDYGSIPGLLREISGSTNVKWFRVGPKWWIQDLDFHKNQDLRPDRLGDDDLPSWPGEEAEAVGVSQDAEIVELRENSGRTPGELRESPSRAEVKKVRSREDNQNQYFIGGGSSRDSRAGAEEPPSPPTASPSAIEEEVTRLRDLHFATCGLSTVPPVAMIREVLSRGKPVALIDDIYQTHGGDVPKYRQQNIVEDLKRLRDGAPARASPVLRREGRKSAAELRQEAIYRESRAFALGGEG